MDQRFTRGEVQRITGATVRQLDYWARLGLVRPRARWGERFFSFTDLVAVETLSRLAARNVPARRLRRAMDALEHGLGHAHAPLASLRVSSNGTRIVVHEPGPDGRPIEPLTGQWVMDFETAVIERKVRAIGNRTAEEWFELGMAWDAAPETLPQAAEAYQHAVHAMPEWVEAHINLGTTLYQLGQIEESCESFTIAVELSPNNSIARFNLGCVYDQMGETRKAIEEFRAALERMPHMADAHLNLALAYEKLGRRTGAMRHFALYIQYAPRGPWADYARTRLGKQASATPSSGAGGKATGKVDSKVTPFRPMER